MSRQHTCLDWIILASASFLAVSLARPGCADGPAQTSVKKDLTKADIDAMMTSLSNWGRWGQEDQRGTLNLITPAKQKAAVALVRDGVTVSLARAAIKEEADGSPAFEHKIVALPKPGDEIAYAGDEFAVRYHGFAQTHLDGLCHLIYKGRMYNGFSQDVLTVKGAGKLGVENFKSGILTRAVLMDMPRHLGVRYLDGKRAIYPEDLEAWEKKSGVKVESGDAVLIHTGRWARREVEGPWDVMKGSAGLHASCLPWLKQRDVALVGSDLALDVLPSGVEAFPQPVHWVCIVAMGMPILDNCDFKQLSQEAHARKRWSFLLTVAPLTVEGATGSPVNPLATF
ncbi:MAG TPA: cyclase family protein [Pirellulales bacterium]|nr:cyclase family protein [Pirellulales bacterium]